jgi:hypothetical protein
MRDTIHEMEETQSSMFQVMEDFPTQSYLTLAFGSMIVSAFFFLIGRRDFAMFIGQWVPSIGVFALMYKLLRPSHERPTEQLRKVGEDVEDVAERTRSRMAS